MNKLRRILSVVLIAAVIVAAVPALSLEAKAANNPYAAWISVFDPTYYTANNAGAAAYAKGDVNKLWKYFIQVGVPKGEQASAEFNVFIYAKNYPDLVKAFGGNMIQYYIHYAQKGKAQGLNAKTLNNGAGQAQATTASITLNKADPSAYEIKINYSLDGMTTVLGFNRLDGYTYNQDSTGTSIIYGGIFGDSKMSFIDWTMFHPNYLQRKIVYAVYNGENLENVLPFPIEYHQEKFSYVTSFDTSQGTVKVYLREMPFTMKGTTIYNVPCSWYSAFMINKNNHLISCDYAGQDMNAFIDFLKRSMNK